MLAQIKAYLVIILATLLLTVCGYAYYTHKENIQLSANVATYKKAAEENLKAKENGDKSCTLSLEALSEHYKQQAELEASQVATGGEILTLPTLTITEKANAAPAKPQSYSDDARLSPDTMRLLDQAYCYGNKDSCTDTAK